MFHPDVFGYFFLQFGHENDPLFKIHFVSAEMGYIHTYINIFLYIHIYTPFDWLTYLHFDTHIFLFPANFNTFLDF